MLKSIKLYNEPKIKINLLNNNCQFFTAHRQLENEHENLEESKKL